MYKAKILKRPMIVYKELKVDAAYIATAPNRGTKWGKVRAGRILRRKAERTNTSCGKGVHAWLARRRGWGGNSLWVAVIPAGTWVFISSDKVRADEMVLVHEIERV